MSNINSIESQKVHGQKRLFDIIIKIQKEEIEMMNMSKKTILRTAGGVILIYIVAVFLSLVVCDRVSELESREDMKLQNGSIVLNIK